MYVQVDVSPYNMSVRRLMMWFKCDIIRSPDILLELLIMSGNQVKIDSSVPSQVPISITPRQLGRVYYINARYLKYEIAKFILYGS